MEIRKLVLKHLTKRIEFAIMEVPSDRWQWIPRLKV